jgi:hypothetical protein
MKTDPTSREELLQLLDAAIDGVDGYESEHGYLRYWNEDRIQRAREVLNSEPSSTAHTIATALGGEAWQSGGGIWLTLIHRPDNHLVVISDDAICEYPSKAAFEQGTPTTTIRLQ